jgi:hypothetical protein
MHPVSSIVFLGLIGWSDGGERTRARDPAIDRERRCLRETQAKSSWIGGAHEIDAGDQLISQVELDRRPGSAVQGCPPRFGRRPASPPWPPALLVTRTGPPIAARGVGSDHCSFPARARARVRSSAASCLEPLPRAQRYLDENIDIFYLV